MYRVGAVAIAVCVVLAVFLGRDSKPVFATSDVALGAACSSPTEYSSAFHCTNTVAGTEHGPQWLPQSGGYSGWTIAYDTGGIRVVNGWGIVGYKASVGTPFILPDVALYYSDNGSTYAQLLCGAYVTVSGACGGTSNHNFELPEDGVTCVDDGTSTIGSYPLKACSWTFTAAATHRYWRLNETSGSSDSASVFRFSLYGSGAAAHVACSPGYATLAVGVAFTLSCQTTDASGSQVVGDVYRMLGQTGVICAGRVDYPFNMTGSSISCVSSVAGVHTLAVQSQSLLENWFGLVVYVGLSNRFTLNCSNCSPKVGELVVLNAQSYAADGSPTNDAWSPTNTDSHRSCTPQAWYTVGHIYTCRWDAAGTYTLVGTDTPLGFTSSLTITVEAAPAASVVCGGTDLGCYLTQIWDTLTTLPYQVVSGIGTFLFVSQTGKSYIDTSGLTTWVFPSIDCRAGQTPTHPDGTHCLPLPFSLPFDVYNLFAVADVTGVPPALSLEIHSPPIDITRSVDVTPLLSTGVMDKIRAVEYVLFLLALVWATGEALKLFGVG